MQEAHVSKQKMIHRGGTAFDARDDRCVHTTCIWHAVNAQHGHPTPCQLQQPSILCLLPELWTHCEYQKAIWLQDTAQLWNSLRSYVALQKSAGASNKVERSIAIAQSLLQISLPQIFVEARLATRHLQHTLAEVEPMPLEGELPQRCCMLWHEVLCPRDFFAEDLDKVASATACIQGLQNYLLCPMFWNGEAVGQEVEYLFCATYQGAAGIIACCFIVPILGPLVVYLGCRLVVDGIILRMQIVIAAKCGFATHAGEAAVQS